MGNEVIHFLDENGDTKCGEENLWEPWSPEDIRPVVCGGCISLAVEEITTILKGKVPLYAKRRSREYFFDPRIRIKIRRGLYN